MGDIESETIQMCVAHLWDSISKRKQKCKFFQWGNRNRKTVHILSNCFLSEIVIIIFSFIFQHTHTEKKKGVWHTKETTSTVYALLPYTITNMLNNRHKSKDCTSRASLARLPGAPFLIQHLFFIIKFFSIVRQMKKKKSAQDIHTRTLVCMVLS